MGTKPQTGAHEPPRRGPVRMPGAKTLAALAVAALIIVFAVANSQKVEVDFLVATTHTPLVVVIVISLLLGFAFGNLMQRRSHRRRQRSAP
jgi:uncharacterized integral membrane protein